MTIKITETPVWYQCHWVISYRKYIFTATTWTVCCVDLYFFRFHDLFVYVQANLNLDTISSKCVCCQKFLVLSYFEIHLIVCLHFWMLLRTLKLYRIWTHSDGDNSTMQPHWNIQNMCVDHIFLFSFSSLLSVSPFGQKKRRQSNWNWAYSCTHTRNVFVHVYRIEVIENNRFQFSYIGVLCVSAFTLSLSLSLILSLPPPPFLTLFIRLLCISPALSMCSISLAINYRCMVHDI